MTQIVSIEIGNITTNVKSDKVEDVITFESRIKEAEDQHLLDNSREFFEMEDKKYITEMGTYENNVYKYEKNNFRHLLHYGISKVADSGNIKLITSIPANQFNAFKEEMKNVIMNNNKISVKIGKEETKNITIEEVAILPEGYSIFKTTPKEYLVEGAKTVIIDIGGGTSELIVFDENGRFVHGDSINSGLLELFDRVQLDIQAKSKKLISIEDVRKFTDGELKVIGLNDYNCNEIVNNFGNELLNLIFGKLPYIMQCNVIVVGGGAEKLKGIISQKIKHALFNTNIKSLCDSNHKVAVAKWRK
ncbi:ParM/StbA family protein [Paraclostridium sordellii]|uniref:ParM/StbA family protein n=1 Tax=Paraclostridium sordellii TaxID=1505 RepID=UPI000E4FDCBB|nr:ParM/StbA family protein [Paeniclostridium sordellii]RGX09341.1 hypothetical protein DWV40_07535 [Paeniclostridium sordellii]